MEHDPVFAGLMALRMDFGGGSLMSHVRTPSPEPRENKTLLIGYAPLEREAKQRKNDTKLPSFNMHLGWENYGFEWTEDGCRRSQRLRRIH